MNIKQNSLLLSSIVFPILCYIIKYFAIYRHDIAKWFNSMNNKNGPNLYSTWVLINVKFHVCEYDKMLKHISDTDGFKHLIYGDALEHTINQP